LNCPPAAVGAGCHAVDFSRSGGDRWSGASAQQPAGPRLACALRFGAQRRTITDPKHALRQPSDNPAIAGEPGESHEEIL